ncbi:small acid-soluble spore protein SspI [Paenibacillus larvae]|nr:small acid-soluble spore protein SspI [Paenibacillus larvae]MDR5597781.1 small acid-soluble spore protein SspI [Paenibacillus larvae]
MPIQLTLRQAIMQRMKGKSEEELKEVINDSIGGQEQVLPGLGVLFEVIWENGNPELHEQLVLTLEEHLK